MINFRHKIMGRLGNNLFQWAYLYSQVKEGAISNWYLQDERYFHPYQSEIKAMLQEGIGKINKIAIHIRRGDYINNSFYVDLMATDYYQRAMKEFNGETFLVFSDDIEWCKKQEIFKECEFSERFNEEEDINRMASCIGHIMSNSSFAWWGAWLSPHGGKVIAPQKWHSDGISRTKLLDSWKVI